MNAHVIENGIIVNTIVVESLDTFPGLIDVKLGGTIGDKYENGVVNPAPVPTLKPPTIVTMRQARLALQSQGLLVTINEAIANGTNEEMKIEWDYATDVKRDWPSLIALTTALGLSVSQVDDLFVLAATK